MRQFLVAVTVIALAQSAYGIDEAWLIEGTRDRPLDQAIAVADGKAIIGLDRKPSLGVHDLKSGAHLFDVTVFGLFPITQRAIAAARDRLVVSDMIWKPSDTLGHSSAFVYDLSDGKQLTQLQLPVPQLRVGMGASVATDGRLAVLNSIGCGDTCFDPIPVSRGVVDVFDITTGKHLHEIMSPDDAYFGEGLAIHDGTIAVSARGRSGEEAGRVLLFDAATGNLQRTLHPTVQENVAPGSRHHFGFDLAMDDKHLVVGDSASRWTPGSLADGTGYVTIFDADNWNVVTEFSAADVGLRGTPRFGASVDIFGNTIIAGAPDNGLTVARLDQQSESSCHAANPKCGEFDGRLYSVAGQKTGAALVIDIPSRNALLGPDLGGDMVAIGNTYAVVRSESGEFDSAYGLSLEGFLPAENGPNLTGKVSSVGFVSPADGDLNGDGVVAFDDFLRLSSNFGRPVSLVSDGDVDNNGFVDFLDFLVLSDNFGKNDVQPVPEPIGSVWFVMLPLVFRLPIQNQRRGHRGG